jgi:hypothetical protein
MPLHREQTVPGTVAHACNPSYPGGSPFKTNPGKKFSRTPSQPRQLGMMGCICHPSYAGSIKRWTVVQTGPGKTIFEK